MNLWEVIEMSQQGLDVIEESSTLVCNSETQ